VAAILDRVMRDRVREFDKRLATATSAVERVRLWVWAILEQAMVPALAEATRPLLVYQARLADDLGPQVWGHRDHLRQPLRAALEEGVRSGELEDIDPETDSEVISYLALGWMHGRVLARSVPSREEAERVVEFAVRGLLGRRAG
jgi:AcrR family transcriptional regulator